MKLYHVTYLGSGFRATFMAVWYCSPPGPNMPFTYVMLNMITRLPAKGFVGARGGTMKKKYFPIFYMFNTKSGHFGPKIKQYI